jgi:CRP-like cAMP-binding protein
MPDPTLNNPLSASLPFIYENLYANHKRVRWKAGTIAYDIGDSHDYTWLILRGIVSLLRPLVEDGRTVEAAPVGPGGMIGYLGAERRSGSVFRAEVQVATEALQLDAGIVRAAVLESTAFRNLMWDYRETLEEQSAQALACRSYHRAEHRLARWLLFAQGHTLSDHLDLTHSDLANILGVSRSVVTEAIRRLERLKLIDSARSQIYLLNRRGLRSAACNCLKSIVRKNIFLPGHARP